MQYTNIKDLYNDVMSCKKCRLAEKRTHVVFGEGNIHADLMFVGEGPGRYEDETGRPFVGAAGRLLDEMIGGLGLERQDVYIANVVKCRPPGNRDPQPDERETCMGYLRAQVAFIQPKVIVCLGRIAAGLILKRDVYMGREHGTCIRIKDFTIIPTFHPAALLHNPNNRADSEADFEVIARELEAFSHAE